MEWLRIIVFTVSALGVVPAAAYVVSRLFAIDRRADVMHYRATSDGWRIALHEFRPADGKKRKGAPVLMCHGLGGNHHIFDFAEGLSLARYLAGEGHHVFLLDLRGAGDSEKAPITDGRRFDWTLQTYLSRDLPTAVDAVLEITGAKTVHWVGHSMGGMLGYSAAQRDLGAKFASLTAICTPARLEHDEFKPVLSSRSTVERYARSYLRRLAQAMAPLYEWIAPLQRRTGNENLKPGHYTRSAANLNEDVPVTLLKEFSHWSIETTIPAEGGETLVGFDDITTPLLAIGGEDDYGISLETVKELVDRAGSKVKKFVALGKPYGQRGAYGHLTPLIGADAATEVYPLISAWLAGGYLGDGDEERAAKKPAKTSSARASRPN